MGLEVYPESPIITKNKAIMMHYSEGGTAAALSLIEPTLTKQGSDSSSFPLLITKAKMKMEAGSYH